MNICVFASGTGTNFEAILKSIKKGFLNSKISLLISNNSGCGAVRIARKNKIDFIHISRKLFPSLSEKDYSGKFISALKKFKIDFIVLAGYMKTIPEAVVKLYKHRIINIHPALLPSFGGKGMYGMNVQKAVIASGVKVSGMTIHFVSGDYDEGKIIFQKCCKVNDSDDEFSLQKIIRKLEHKYYPEIIKKFEEGLVIVMNPRVVILKNFIKAKNNKNL